ncbi:hypothetical protein IW261DRAFT_1557001 [Armillaria novae-zelandiae]|uniref:Uncharacterized protein n=1 Tax=Armillaria novae-zelandiae TaxID=153914 RepID=A0AA39TH62_9AGAR|nr:hypothetical protein IW261DRAFT_1557001 [Armillaria novae-zelandiae]
MSCMTRELPFHSSSFTVPTSLSAILFLIPSITRPEQDAAVLGSGGRPAARPTGLVHAANDRRKTFVDEVIIPLVPGRMRTPEDSMGLRGPQGASEAMTADG